MQCERAAGSARAVRIDRGRPLIAAAVAVEAAGIVGVDLAVADSDFPGIEKNHAGVGVAIHVVAGGRSAGLTGYQQAFPAIGLDGVVVDEIVAAVKEGNAAAGVAVDGVVMDVRLRRSA